MKFPTAKIRKSIAGKNHYQKKAANEEISLKFAANPFRHDFLVLFSPLNPTLDLALT